MCVKGDNVEIICEYEGIFAYDRKIPTTYSGNFSVINVRDLEMGWLEVTAESNEPDNPPSVKINKRLGFVNCPKSTMPIAILDVADLSIKYLVYKH